METSNIKSGFVSIIGLPNAGKSTFLNAIIKDNLAITSKKPQTTRKNLKGIYNDDDSQIVFLDTPGIHSGKTKLDEYMSSSIKKSIDSIDLIIAIVDVMTYKNDDYSKLNAILKNSHSKKILVLNKFDVYSKENLGSDSGEFEAVKLNCGLFMEVAAKFDSSISFEKIFLISALKKKHIEDVISCVKELLPYGERYYNEDDLTDEPMKQIVADMIRQQCLYKLSDEIPHGVAITVDSMKMSKSKCMNIDATIICEKENHKGIIIGKSGAMIKNIGTASRIAIEDFMHDKVNLKLNVVVKDNWRDERTLLANFGYDIKNI